MLCLGSLSSWQARQVREPERGDTMDQKTEAKLKELAGDTRNRFAWAAKLALDQGGRITELEAEVARLKPYEPPVESTPVGATSDHPAPDPDEPNVEGGGE